MDGRGNPYACPGFFTLGQLWFLDTRVINEKIHCKPPKGYYPPREPRNNMAALNSMGNNKTEARALCDGFEMLDNTEGEQDES